MARKMANRCIPDSPRYVPTPVVAATFDQRMEVVRRQCEIEPGETNCLADDAVSCELVSTPNSLLTGKLTGNFANSGPQQRFPHLINELIQRLAAKFPTQRNREFLQP